MENVKNIFFGGGGTYNGAAAKGRGVWSRSWLKKGYPYAHCMDVLSLTNMYNPLKCRAHK